MFFNAVRALNANKLKTLLIYMSLTFSIIAIFLITAIANGVIDMYSTMLKSDGDIIVTQAKISDTFFSNVDTNLIPKIKKIDGVKKVSALIVGASPVEKLPIVAIYGSSKNRFNHYKLISGEYPKNSEVIVGENIYNRLQNKDKITIANKKFKVSGVFKSNLGFENGGVVMNLKDAGKIFNKSASMFLITLDISKDIKYITKQINSLSNKIEAKSTDQFIENYNQFKIINNSSYVISLIAFATGLLSIASIMSITINQRKDEFGIMRALGISSKKIITSLIIESLLIGFISFATALILSVIILNSIKESTVFHGYLSGEISWQLSNYIFITTMIMAMLGSIIPAISAARIDPIILIQRGCA